VSPPLLYPSRFILPKPLPVMARDNRATRSPIPRLSIWFCMPSRRRRSSRRAPEGAPSSGPSPDVHVVLGQVDGEGLVVGQVRGERPEDELAEPDRVAVKEEDVLLGPDRTVRPVSRTTRCSPMRSYGPGPVWISKA